MVAAREDHRTVLLHQAVDALNVRADGTYMDGTFGRGGHSRLILDRLGERGRLVGFDKDQEAVRAARQQFGGDPRFSMVHGSFTRIAAVAQELGLQRGVDGVLLDLGVSSPQLDEAGRGFSFMQDGPLDMRMDRTSGVSAAEWLANAEEEEMTTVFRDYGEERFARRIARAIVHDRAESPLLRTRQLAALIERASPFREKHKHPATRTFQAIRIHINRELEDLQLCLRDSLEVLAAGGRLVVISFHSLEDRIVKRFCRRMAGRPEHAGDTRTQDERQERAKMISTRPIVPSQAEIDRNPRSRSARLRALRRL